MRENIEARNDTIAGILNLMLEDGHLVRRRKGKQKILWSLADNGKRERIKDEEKPLKTGSRLSTGSQVSKTPGIGPVDRKRQDLPCGKPTGFPIHPPPYTRAREAVFFHRGRKGAEKYQAEALAGSIRTAQSEDRLAGPATIQECAGL